MKRLTYFLIGAGALLALTPNAAQAQCIGTNAVVCTTRTTLSANVAVDDRVIQVTSATGFTAGNGVWIDFEFMEIVSISGTQITVSRGQRGTQAQAHDNADVVLTGVDTGGPLGAGHFNTRDPDVGQDCTRGQGQASHLPWINIRDGWVWTCDVGTDWTATQKTVRTHDSEPTSF